MANPHDLNKAVQLYEILGKHVPKFDDIPDNYLDFIGEIIKSIKDKQDYTAYFDAIQIMSDVTYNVLTSSNPDAVLELFSNGLMEWRIIELVQFFRELGYPDD